MRGFVKVLWVDLALLLAAIAVWADEQGRVAYAPKIGLHGSFDYSILVQSFSLTGGSINLQSPPTLSWIQVMAVLFIVVNAGYLLRRDRARAKQPVQAAPSP